MRQDGISMFACDEGAILSVFTWNIGNCLQQDLNHGG